jgi:hypothetical protein
MIGKAENIVMAALLAAVYCSLALGQTPPPAILEVDVENVVEYQSDTSDLSRIATNPSVTPAVPPRTFFPVSGIGDIVAVNGQSAKGTVAFRAHAFDMRPAPNPGQSIADTMRASIRYQTFEILKSDGTPVGTIVALGPNGGSPPPGAPSAQTGGNLAIVGGTGAFLGVRGQYGGASNSQRIPARAASVAEDPANRRVNGGGSLRFVLHLIPISAPQIVITPSGPAVAHSSDFTLVTSSKPAAAGEILSLFCAGLGPTRPGVDSGQPFPATPLAVVNSPVEVKVNGKPAEVLAAIGFPGAMDSYQVNFRVPPDTSKGVATIQVSAAWIAGTPVSITVQ